MRPRFHLFIFICFFSALSLGSSTQSYAQESTYRPYTPENQKIPEPPLRNSARIKYEHLADTILNYNPTSYSYSRLRRFYALTPYYDPLADEAVKKLQNLAFYADNNRPINGASTTPELEAYKEHLQLHIGSLAVVTQALLFAKEDSYFGNPIKLKRIKNGLFENLIKGGDGLTLGHAYTVYTLPEETALLRHLGYEILQTKARQEGMIYYNLHYVIDPLENKNLAIFVDITAPMQALKRQENEK